MKKSENNTSQLLSWREAFHLNIRTLKLLQKRHPRLLPLTTLNCCWQALTPYVGIYLSALILEELAGNRSQEKLSFLIMAALVSAGVIALVSALLNKCSSITNSMMQIDNFYKLLGEKMLDMDYCTADTPKTRQTLSLITQHGNGGGWGILRAQSNFGGILHAVFTLLGGAALTVTLFTSKVPESAGNLLFLNSPLFLVPIILVMLAVTYIAPMLANKSSSYFALYSGNHILANRLFSFFGFLGSKKAFATDARIYSQETLCEKHCKDKTGTFSSKGQFARLARGPMGLYSSASAAVSMIFTCLVYVFVCLKTWAGAFSIGMMTQYIASISRVSNGVSSLIQELGDMRNNATFLKEILNFLDTPNEMYQGSLTVEKRRDRQYELEFRDVSFRYPGSEQYALRHANMKFQVGRRLAVVGENGSGKTTFIKLLCRLYDPTEGVILLNGLDIRKYNYREYMSIFSVVFQDFALTAFTLGQNVAAGMNYNTSRVESCLEKAGFGPRFRELEKGGETYLTKALDKEGVDMSGGEQQKIAMARTLYKDSAFMILDEPTAALDPIAEAEVYSKFDEIIEDKTAVYISHRLSSCRFCDEILVFDHGKIIQQGSHNQLVADTEGKYYKLWHAQAQYYTENANGN